MIVRVYSVFDSKVGAYLPPFFMRAHGEAMRACIEACRDVKHNFHAYSADYTLFCIGEFDDTSGIISMLDVKENLGTMLSLMSLRENGNG